MKKKLKRGNGLLWILFLSGNILAQTSEWITNEIDKGKITVSYKFSERTDENGLKVLLIEDSSTIIDNLNIQNCIYLMNDVSKHKLFTGDYSSERVKSLSDSECIVYYYSKNPWPIPNSDCVAKMVSSVNANNNTVKFKLTAAPTEFRMGDVNRMTYFEVVYSFKDLGNGKVEITETGKSTPPVKVPLWIIKSAFPRVPANALRKMVKLAKEK